MLQAPATRAGPDGRAEDFAEEAKYFVECRILQRDVEVILEGVSNQNLVGSIVHPKGNIAEALLREGFAKCIDWSIALATSGPEPLRAAERIAKEKRVRLWRSYQPSNQLSADKRTFTAKVVEIVMGDALVVQKETGEEMKIWLSSVRPPRLIFILLFI
uniref:TNase-like domain-containing protein n=1 Tax=Parascaris equorum TaxID=6256 RepID=A0A914R5R4_PAREQ